jgi:hypothetical protein
MQRRLYAKQRQGVRVTHTGFQGRVTCSRNAKCPLNLSNRIGEAGNRFLPDRRWIGIRKGATYRFWMAQALLLVKTSFLRPRNGRGEIAICRANGRADVRSHGQSVSGPGPCPVRDRVQSESSTERLNSKIAFFTV